MYEYMKNVADVMPDSDLVTHELADLLPMMDGEEYAGLLSSVRSYGVIEPILLCEGKILDGRNRYKACKELGIPCPARVATDLSPSDAVEILNINRRHLTKSQIAWFAQELLAFFERQAEQTKLKNLKPFQSTEVVPGTTSVDLSCSSNLSAGANSNKSRDKVAKATGISSKTIGQAKYVKINGTEQDHRSVASGAVSVKAKEKEIKTRKASTKKFNRTNENIGWAQYSWNPITGCKFGCEYCYAKEIHDRYFPQQPFCEYVFHHDRLNMPQNTKASTKDINNRVFVCSMGELFGDWVPAEDIKKILDVCARNTQWTYLFLTKNPNRLPDFSFPQNAWIGSTVDTVERVKPTLDAFQKMPTTTIKFISCEPLLSPIVLGELAVLLNWVIIGALSKGHAKQQPPAEWIESLFAQARKANVPIWFKDNLVFRPQEIPTS